jgi:uncharacterized beta-barrel protein YwiB (DUF1934 family)
MKMFKEVSLTVSSEITPIDRDGLALDDAETEKTETKTSAFMKIDGNIISIYYLEEKEGAKVNTDIEISADAVRVLRRGAIESDFLFRVGEAHSSVYSIPPYSFDSEIKTKKIRNGIDVNGGAVTIFYDMSIGKDLRAVKMRIEVYP